MQPIASRSQANAENIYLIVFPVLCNSFCTALGAIIYHHSVRSEFLVVFIGGLFVGIVLGIVKLTILLIIINVPSTYTDYIFVPEFYRTSWGAVILVLDFIVFSLFPFIVTPLLGNWLLNFHADIPAVFSDEIAGLVIVFVCIPCLCLSLIGCVLSMMMHDPNLERRLLLNSNV